MDLHIIIGCRRWNFGQKIKKSILVSSCAGSWRSGSCMAYTGTPQAPRSLEAASEQPDHNRGNPIILHTIEICGVPIEPM